MQKRSKLVLPVPHCAVLCGAVWAAIVYAAIQDGRHADVQSDCGVTHTCIDALLRSSVMGHPSCQVLCTAA